MFRSSIHRQVTGLCSGATEPSMVKRETYMYNVNTHHTIIHTCTCITHCCSEVGDMRTKSGIGRMSNYYA